jgi:hypothetical protein
LSCSDPRPAQRARAGRPPCPRPATAPGRVAAVVLVVLAVVSAVGGCAAGADRSSAAGGAAPTASAVPADQLTRRIAEVESARQCAVGSLSFADEADITTDLDTRLAAADLTHAQWKDWHDALVDSPDLVAQLVEVSAAGCTGG